MEQNASFSQLTLTPSAIQKIKHLMARDPQVVLRIVVESGGCSGFRYQFKTDTQVNAGDRIFTSEGVRCAVDDLSWPFIQGATLDYIETLSASYFTITQNPQAQTGCGCGQSFSV